MKEKYEREMGDYVKEQNKKYKELVKEKIIVEEERDQYKSKL